MKKIEMKIATNILITAILSIALLSCTKESVPNLVQGEQVMTQLTLSVAPLKAPQADKDEIGTKTSTVTGAVTVTTDDMVITYGGVIEPDTKAATKAAGTGLSAENESKIHKVSVFQFTSAGAPIGAHQYDKTISTTLNADGNYALGIALTATEDAGSKLYVVANATFTEAMKDVTTEESFNDKALTLGADYDPTAEAGLLPMMGVYTGAVAVGTPLATLSLERLVAKVVFTYTVDDRFTALTPESVGIYSVAKSANLSERITGESLTTANYPDNEVASNFVDYTAVAATAGPTTLTWYIPENLKGINDAITAAEKRILKNVPITKATFIQFIGKLNTDAHTDRIVDYKFLLGNVDLRIDKGGHLGNFNVERNTAYNIDVVIIGAGESDDRVVIALPPPANCYMVGLDGRKIKINAITRVNEFWSMPAGIAVEPDYDGTGMGGQGFPAIGDADQWYAEVIWADFNPATYPVKIEQNGTRFGTGTRELLEVTLPDLSSASRGKGGNVIIGMKKKGAVTTATDYLWSWHIWITDYDPDAATGVTAALDKAFDAPGGQVHRYSDKSGQILWSTGDYKDKVIMDRNLGATWTGGTPAQSSDGAESIKTHGMFYQWGRKGPFPHATTYTTWPSDSDYTTIPTYGKAATSTNWPSDTYISGPKTKDFVVANPHLMEMEMSQDDEAWRDVPKSKSLYDPCPEGWRVPLHGTWSNFSNTSFAPDFSENVNSGRTYIGSVVADNRVAAWYPASGQRMDNSGLMAVGSSGLSWASDVYEGRDLSWTLYYSRTTLFSISPHHRENGFPVRCLQD